MKQHMTGDTYWFQLDSQWAQITTARRATHDKVTGSERTSRFVMTLLHGLNELASHIIEKPLSEGPFKLSVRRYPPGEILIERTVDEFVSNTERPKRLTLLKELFSMYGEFVYRVINTSSNLSMCSTPYVVPVPDFPGAEKLDDA